MVTTSVARTISCVRGFGYSWRTLLPTTPIAVTAAGLGSLFGSLPPDQAMALALAEHPAQPQRTADSGAEARHIAS